MGEIENAILDDIIQFTTGGGALPSGAGVAPLQRAIVVNGVQVQYRRVLETVNGVVSIGTYFP